MMVLSPAYGRDYANKAAVRADWDANEDFTVAGQSILVGKTMDRSRLETAYSWAKHCTPEYPAQRVSIRYARLRRTLVIDIIQP